MDEHCVQMIGLCQYCGQADEAIPIHGDIEMYIN
jgi:hypothetical protein